MARPKGSLTVNKPRSQKTLRQNYVLLELADTTQKFNTQIMHALIEPKALKYTKSSRLAVREAARRRCVVTRRYENLPINASQVGDTHRPRVLLIRGCLG